MALSTQVLATPIFDTFGPLPETEFGGDGIPNDAVAIGTQLFDGTSITAALTAHERFFNPDVENDGAGTFTALTGTNTGGPGSTSSTVGALWSFGYFIKVEGGGRTIQDLQFDLYYDFDPASDTAIADLGVIDITAGVLLGGVPISVAEGSQNLFFSFLGTPAPPVLTPPSGSVPSFDPNAEGEYTFAIVASDPISGFAVEIVAIDVQVVPEPTSLALLGLGGLLFTRRRRNR
ncbi:MAG: PEP-CTERM sorting domain-containing protein [Planctomycetota bacterium]